MRKYKNGYARLKAEHEELKKQLYETQDELKEAHVTIESLYDSMDKMREQKTDEPNVMRYRLSNLQDACDGLTRQRAELSAQRDWLLEHAGFITQYRYHKKFD